MNYVKGPFASKDFADIPYRGDIRYMRCASHRLTVYGHQRQSRQRFLKPGFRAQRGIYDTHVMTLFRELRSEIYNVPPGACAAGFNYQKNVQCFCHG